MTDEEWQNLSANFTTSDLLDAVDEIDSLRDHLNDGEDGRPPELRTNLLKLHQLAMRVVNHGEHSQEDELFDLAMDLEDQVSCMMTHLEQVQETLEQLVALMPDRDADDD